MSMAAGLVLCAGAGTARAADGAGKLAVEAWLKTGKPKRYDTRILSHLRGFKPSGGVKLSRFGGWAEGTPLKATGFFRMQKIGSRWWVIDPQGCRFLHVGINSVGPQRGPQFRKAFPGTFDGERDWAAKTLAMLFRCGFNGTGNWSDDKLLAGSSQRPVYTPSLSFMGSFGRSKKLVKQVPGHLGYPDSLIPVFEPDFEPFCNELAMKLAPMRKDPYLLGYFTDNELELPHSSLDRHFKLGPDTPGRKAAELWLRRRQGGKLDVKKITDADREEWIGYVMDRYHRIVVGAIRKVDPNHMVLGSRLHGGAKRIAPLWKVAGRYLDATAVNIYGRWTPTDDVRQWVKWSGKPVMATEWYAKGQDSGMKNLTGAGWTVRTQKDRGHFYQNFVLALIESKGCVGWHYFKYADNDPLDKRADPSNRDSNKGIVNVRYEPYTPLLDAMKQVNTQTYPLTRYFDR